MRRSFAISGALAAAICLLGSWPGQASSGPNLLRNIYPGAGNSYPYDFQKVGTKTLFFADDHVHGFELWRTDGTHNGTAMLKDINPGSGSATEDSAFVRLGSWLLFNADDGTHGAELWRTDGSATGTKRVKDINPGPAGSLNGMLGAPLNGKLLFRADDGTHGSELWRSDGTKAGTVMVKNIAPGSAGLSFDFGFLQVFGSLGFLSADDGVHGYELWRTDGTATGTYLLKDINPAATGDAPDSPTKVGNTWFFQADNGTDGPSLWKTDGTRSGTKLVKDINPLGSGSSASLGPMTALGGHLVLAADDGGGAGQHGQELFISDGTPAGTKLLKDIYPGTLGSNPQNFIRRGTKVFFNAKSDLGYGLWETDGTAGGTQLVKVVNPNTGNDYPFENCGDWNLGGRLYFIADDGTHGLELWTSDGTTSGTRLLKDLNPSGDANPGCAFLAKGLVYFGADDGTHGSQLWVTNGKRAGTRAVTNLAGPGTSADPRLFNNGVLFIRASESTHGIEPWVYRP